MRSLLSALACAFVVSVAQAQTEWVTNGQFTGTVAPWVLGGAYSVNPGLEVGWNTTGFGASDSFGVNAGGQVTPSPYPPNWIEQQIIVVQGLTYEFRCDASGARPNAPTVNNADIGTIWVEVDNVEVARHAFGSYTSGQIKRAQLCGRFAPTTSGPVTLRIYFQRQYLGGSANPRMNIDNVSVQDVFGPTFWVAGNRQLGATVSREVRGTPGAAFATFVSLSSLPAGMPLPGIVGALYLNPSLTFGLQIGTLDALGGNSTTMAIPNDPMFLSYGLYYQAGMWDSVPSLGLPCGILASQ